MKSGDRMEPAPTEGWLGEGKSSKTWRGPFTVRRSAGTERDLQEIRGWEHSQCFPPLEGSGVSAGILDPNLSLLGPSRSITS